MPKESRVKCAATELRQKVSPYRCSSSSKKSASPEDIKEWDEVRCPICMEHPHNGVLLLCSSHGNGCRPFMCDTSYRHSNCLDQYRKAVSASKLQESDTSEEQGTLTCPLCRGLVTGWTVLESARSYMNAKARSCSKESCGFTGMYGELRKHARKEHPSVCPAQADPERQQDWRRMEEQQDLADLFSMLQSVINEDEVGMSIDEDDEEERDDNAMTSPSIMVLVVVRVRQRGETASGAGSSPQQESSSPRSYLRSHRGTRSLFFWGESFSDEASLGSTISDEVDRINQTLQVSEEVNGGVEDTPTSQVRILRIIRITDDEDDDVD